MSCYVAKPAECFSTELEAFVKLLEQGDQIHIEPNILAKNINNAELLAFYVHNEQVVGIGAVKNPQASYRRKVFERAGAPELKYDFKYELGYFVTKPEYHGQGICKAILTELLKHMPDDTTFFATTKSAAMRKIFTSKGFMQLGEAWTTEKLELYIL
jgi:predicted GNAT family N-acyltransferase